MKNHLKQIQIKQQESAGPMDALFCQFFSQHTYYTITMRWNDIGEQSISSLWPTFPLAC